MTNMTVIEAEASLQKAKAEARAQRVEDSRKQLREVRAKAKTLRAELAEICAEVKEGDTAVTSARTALYKIDDEIARLAGPGGDLLDEPEDREAEIAALREHRAEVHAKLENGLNRTGRRMRGVEIAKALEHMQHQAANLLNIIAHGGEPGNGWEGGVFRV